MRELAKYLEKCIPGMDIHILEIKIGTNGPNQVVKIVVDTPDGITSDQLASISRLLGDDDGIKEHIGNDVYRLELTSPGIAAGISERWQFPRHIGRNIKVQMKKSPDEQNEPVQLIGELLQADDQGIHLQLPRGEEEILWDHIERAFVQTKW